MAAIPIATLASALVGLSDHPQIFRIISNISGCDLWCLKLSDASKCLLSDPQALAILSQSELAQFDKFRYHRDRLAYFAKRLLIRNVLCKYAVVTPEAWKFTANEHGLPMLSAEHKVDHLHFNLSRTTDLAVCAISKHGSIGIDVEDITGPDITELSTTILSVKEHRKLQRLPARERGFAMLRYWTLKEAYAKCRGVGLSLPISESCFDYEDPESVHMTVLSDSDKNANPLRFNQVILLNRYLIAVAQRVDCA